MTTLDPNLEYLLCTQSDAADIAGLSWRLERTIKHLEGSILSDAGWQDPPIDGITPHQTFYKKPSVDARGGLVTCHVSLQHGKSGFELEIQTHGLAQSQYHFIEPLRLDSSNAITPDAPVDDVVAVLERWRDIVSNALWQNDQDPLSYGEQYRATRQQIDQHLAALFEAAQPVKPDTLRSLIVHLFYGKPYKTPRLTGRVNQTDLKHDFLTPETAQVFSNLLPGLHSITRTDSEHCIRFKLGSAGLNTTSFDQPLSLIDRMKYLQPFAHIDGPLLTPHPTA